MGIVGQNSLLRRNARKKYRRMAAAGRGARHWAVKTGPRVIQGRVLDYATQAPVAGVRVRAFDTIAVTDKYGRFQFRVLNAASGEMIQIEASLPG
jgi:hypothetical protein